MKSVLLIAVLLVSDAGINKLNVECGEKLCTVDKAALEAMVEHHGIALEAIEILRNRAATAELRCRLNT